MNQVHPDVSLLPMLTEILGIDFNYHLYTAPSSPPTRDSILSDFTEEAGAGYALVAVDGTDFTVTGVAGHQAFAIAGDIAFTPDVGVTFTNYGYYVTDQTNTTLIAFGHFDSGPIVTTGPATLTLGPRFGDNSKYAS